MTIQARLAEKGVTITLAGISGFIRRRKKNADPHIAEGIKKQPPKKQTPVETAIEMLDRLSIK